MRTMPRRGVPAELASAALTTLDRQSQSSIWELAKHVTDLRANPDEMIKLSRRQIRHIVMMAVLHAQAEGYTRDMLTLADSAIQVEDAEEWQSGGEPIRQFLRWIDRDDGDMMSERDESSSSLTHDTMHEASVSTHDGIHESSMSPRDVLTDHSLRTR